MSDATTTTYVNPIEKHIAELEAAIQSANALYPSWMDIKLIKEECPQIQEVEVKTCSKSPEWRIEAVAKDRGEVAAMLRAFGKRGFHQAFTPHDINRQRAYTLRRDGVEIALWISFTGDGCRMVKVGTTTEPVYELRCDESSRDESEGE